MTTASTSSVSTTSSSSVSTASTSISHYALKPVHQVVHFCQLILVPQLVLVRLFELEVLKRYLVLELVKVLLAHTLIFIETHVQTLLLENETVEAVLRCRGCCC